MAGRTVQDLVEGLADGRQGVGRSHTDTGNQLPGPLHPFGLRTAGGNDRFLIGMDMDDAAIGFQSVDTLTHYHIQQQRVHCLFLDVSHDPLPLWTVPAVYPSFPSMTTAGRGRYQMNMLRFFP